VVFVVGTAIGFITPPYGLNLFVVSAVCKVPFGQVMRSIWIMLIPLMLAWLLITVSPWMTSALQPVK
jgi:C4-dicarboxylate transporter DctM subunit